MGNTYRYTMYIRNNHVYREIIELFDKRRATQSFKRKIYKDTETYRTINKTIRNKI